MNQPPCPSETYWRVRKGDTLYKIAQLNGITLASLIRANPGINPNVLYIGQLICLPIETPCPSGIFWRVAAGDTLWTIAQEAGTTIEKLLELNPDIDPNNLQIDQSICLPG